DPLGTDGAWSEGVAKLVKYGWTLEAPQVVIVRCGSLLVLRAQLPGPHPPLVVQAAWRECGLGVPAPFPPHGTLLAVVGCWCSFRAFVASHALLGVVAVCRIQKHVARSEAVRRPSCPAPPTG